MSKKISDPIELLRRAEQLIGNLTANRNEPINRLFNDITDVLYNIDQQSTRLPSAEANPNGLHKKYIFLHTDGTPIDPQAVYFVLRIDELAKDQLHAQACREACYAWIKYIESTWIKYIERYHDKMLPVAMDLRNLLRKIEAELL